MMVVSVLIPGFNAESTIAETLESVLCQTYSNFELILINDGSTDRTPEIMASYSQKDSRVQLISHKKMGMGASLNAAIPLARGEWIVRMDADDVMMPNRIERQLAFVPEHPDIAVASSLVYYINDNGRIIGKSYSNLRTREHFQEYLDRSETIGFNHPAVILKKSVFLKVGGFRPQFWPADDLDLWNRIAEQGHLILVQQEYLLKYRIHASSVSISHARKATLMTAWMKQCMIHRRGGLPEPSLGEFLDTERAHPMWVRLNRRRKEFAKILYKAAVYSYSKRQHLKAVTIMLACLLLQPSYCVKQVLHKSLLFGKGVE